MDIKLVGIRKKFGDTEALNNLNITFREGCINCLMGASGIGKTTVTNLLMGLLLPDAGEIEGLQNKKVAAVFQEDRLIEHWDAVKNIRLVCNKTITTEMIVKELEDIGLTECQNKPVNRLSGGMRRRVAVVRSMLAQSDIIILDEPFKGMDEKLKYQVIEYVKKRAMGKTLIVVTHDKGEVEQLKGELITLS